jgi:hypothetical protein
MREFAAVQLCFRTLTKSDFMLRSIPNLIYSKVLEELISETNCVAMAICQPMAICAIWHRQKDRSFCANWVSTLCEAALALQS